MSRDGVFLLTVGDEILDGRIQNTNAAWFGERLRHEGIPVIESRSVADQIKAIARALRDGAAHPIVVVTGGLGPTNDDRTLESAAAAFKLPLRRAAAALKHVTDRYKKRGLPLTPARLKMTMIPKGGKVVANPNGTAPGVHLRARGADFFFLPGPPGECRPMFEKAVLPLARKALRSRKLVKRQFWRTFGRGEGDVYALVSGVVEPLEAAYPDSFTFGIHITFPYIDLTMEVRDAPKGNRPTAREIDTACSTITAALGPLCFTNEREALADAVAALLRKHGGTVATAESCTGGLLGKMLTDQAGSSLYYLGGMVSYANSAKEALLGVNSSTLLDHGAVSEECVREMAEAARARLGADYALAISGVSGPGGGSEAKPIGTTFIALASAERTRIVHQVILRGIGNREQNRVIAAHLALDALRTELLGSPDHAIPVN